MATKLKGVIEMSDTNMNETKDVGVKDTGLYTLLTLLSEHVPIETYETPEIPHVDDETTKRLIDFYCNYRSRVNEIKV